MSEPALPASDTLRKALYRAYVLGQIYWLHADSEGYLQHAKADRADAKFRALVEETVAALPVTVAPEFQAQVDAELADAEARFRREGPSDKHLLNIAQEWFCTGENQHRDDGYYWRSKGAVTNVRESDLLAFARAAMALVVALPAPAEAAVPPEDEELEQLEAVIACLGDDAAKLRDANPEDEMADTMDDAATLLELLKRPSRVDDETMAVLGDISARLAALPAAPQPSGDVLVPAMSPEGRARRERARLAHPCSACSGKGWIKNHSGDGPSEETCRACGGDGVDDDSLDDPSGGHGPGWAACPDVPGATCASRAECAGGCIRTRAAPAAPMSEDEIHAHDWWCPRCKESVPPEMVTKDGTHYLESGGCGGPVRGELIKDAAPAAPQSRDLPRLSRESESLDRPSAAGRGLYEAVLAVVSDLMTGDAADAQAGRALGALASAVEAYERAVLAATGWVEASLVCEACAGDAPRGKCLNPRCVGGPIVRELVPDGVQATAISPDKLAGICMTCGGTGIAKLSGSFCTHCNGKGHTDGVKEAPDA